jgi:hypothetical protein
MPALIVGADQQNDMLSPPTRIWYGKQRLSRKDIPMQHIISFEPNPDTEELNAKGERVWILKCI